jgi:hypothetical protein
VRDEKNVSPNGWASVAVQRQPDSPETGHRIENLVREHTQGTIDTTRLV